MEITISIKFYGEIILENWVCKDSHLEIRLTGEQIIKEDIKALSSPTIYQLQ